MLSLESAWHPLLPLASRGLKLAWSWPIVSLRLLFELHRSFSVIITCQFVQLLPSNHQMPIPLQLDVKLDLFHVYFSLSAPVSPICVPKKSEKKPLRWQEKKIENVFIISSPLLCPLRPKYNQMMAVERVNRKIFTYYINSTVRMMWSWTYPLRVLIALSASSRRSYLMKAKPRDCPVFIS